jgi:hypothetical protein
MKRYDGFGLPETEGTRCRGSISNNWVVSKLREEQDPERPLAWELLIRKAVFFAEQGWRRHPELRAYLEKADLEQDLLLHIHQISLRPQYQNLHWEEFSKILTVALPNRIKNVRDRFRVTPYFSLYPDREIDRALSKQSAPPKMHLNSELLRRILTAFREKIRGRIQEQLGHLRAVRPEFQNLAEEMLWVLSQSEDAPGKSFHQLLFLLGYRGPKQMQYLAASLQSCCPDSLSLTPSDVWELCCA